MKVLITDDDEMILMLYRAIFGKYPQIEVKFATSVEECKMISDSGKFDLVFMDCDLGSRNENGLDLLKKIKTEDRDAHVFMATTHDDTEFKHQCFELGASGLIPKSGSFITKIFETIEADLRPAA